MQLRSRYGTNLTPWFPHLRTLRREIDGACVLDGEIVVFDDSGMPDFDRLKRGAPAMFVAFDILRAGRQVVIDHALRDRREVLERIVPTSAEGILLSRYWEGVGDALFAEAERRGLEGVVLKRLDSLYTPGTRSGNWVKVRTEAGTAAVRQRMQNAHRN